jgi:predicted dienelactone hydrolase
LGDFARQEIVRQAGVDQGVSSSPYDPLPAVVAGDIAVHDLEFTDSKRDRRLPLRVYLPAEKMGPQPVILFSHGLGGSRNAATYLGRQWASRGYVAVFLQHPGSDEDVWRGVALGSRRSTLTRAANGEQLNLRKGDVSAVLDQLEVWNRQADHELVGRMDLQRVGMSGHSFGARTTQQVSGETTSVRRGSAVEKRIRAAVIMSPGVPATGNPQRAFGQVKLPWLLMTGTHDDSPIGEQTPESRRRVYAALPPGDKYELVLNQAEHSVFGDRPGERKTPPSRAAHHRSIKALTTAFWDAYLREDPAAKAWLQGPGARGMLDPADLWQNK